jgi:hypothetical protein
MREIRGRRGTLPDDPPSQPAPQPAGAVSNSSPPISANPIRGVPCARVRRPVPEGTRAAKVRAAIRELEGFHPIVLGRRTIVSLQSAVGIEPVSAKLTFKRLTYKSESDLGVSVGAEGPRSHERSPLKQ